MEKQELNLDVLEELSSIEGKMKTAIETIDGRIKELKEKRSMLMNTIRSIDPSFLKRTITKK